MQTAPSVPATSSGGATGASGEFLTIEDLRRQYLDYAQGKAAEIAEAKEARRYRHGAQYTEAQIETLNKRKQPVVTYSRISRKIDGVVGLIEKIKMGPKAVARTPQHADGADLATSVLRYVLDENHWDAKSTLSASDAATEGIGGIELVVEEGDHGDKEVGFEIVIPDSFFYDPRSIQLDFSDARYMGVTKWVTIEEAQELFPDKADLLGQAVASTEFTSNPDREQKWVSTDRKRVRLVDQWYKSKGQWCYAMHTGSVILKEGVSPHVDNKKRTICKFIMFSANVDHDGDRYGFVRHMKSAQDEINARRSRGLFELNSRRIIADAGAFDDIEVARREAMRPDGVVIKNPSTEASFDDAAKAHSLQGQLDLLQEAKNEIENFGPNPALIGQGIDNKSGRAIAMLMQAGIAELGPYIIAYKGWKKRVYRALFCDAQTFWNAERWIRVTDSEQLDQYIRINGLEIDPVTGFRQIVNAIGSLDVDIIIDEGPDALTMEEQDQQVLQAIAQSGVQVPPEVVIELSGLSSDRKKRVTDMMKQAQQPGPAQALQLAHGEAKVKETEANAKLKGAQAVKTAMDAGVAATSMGQPQQAPQPEQQQQQFY